MKFKKLLLASIFLLAILTIGAVSASDNVTDSDALDTVDEITLDSEDSSEVLSDGSYYDEDFYIYVQENYTQGKRDWNSSELVYIASYSRNNSTIDVLIDDVEKQSISVTEGHFSVGTDENGIEYGIYYKNVYPTELGLDYGAHNLKVNVNGNTRINASINIAEKEDFTIFLQNPYYCEEEYWKTPSFLIIDSNNLNSGKLEVYVNGTRKLNYTVTNGDFEEIADCSNKSRYVAPSDLFAGYGKYNIQINFTENGVTKTLKDENVDVAKFAPTTNPKIELYFHFDTLIIPADNVAQIYLPREATGKLTISYNNVCNEPVDYSKGYGEHYIHSWDLNHLGENEITVKYVGDDFGTLTKTETVTVLPNITCPDYVKVGEGFALSLLTHEWVNGDLKVYDYAAGIKGKLLGSAEIYRHAGNQFSTASVKLSLLKAGLNRLCLDYYDYAQGHYEIFKEVYVIQNSEKVTVEIPSKVENGNSFDMTVNAPDIDFTFVQISVDGGDSEFVMLKNGTATKSISNLTDGRHTIRVFYDNQYYSNGEWLRDVYLNTFSVTVNMVATKLTAPKISTTYNVGKYLVITLKGANKGLAGKKVTVTLNGKSHDKTTDSKGQIRISSYNLAPKTYTVKIRFKEDKNYFASSVDSKIVVGKASPKITASNKAFKAKTKTKKYTITLRNNKKAPMKNKKVSLKVKGKTYYAKTNSKGKATFKITKLNKKGTFKAVIKRAADSYYKYASKTVKITVKK